MAQHYQYRRALPDQALTLRREQSERFQDAALQIVGRAAYNYRAGEGRIRSGRSSGFDSDHSERYAMVAAPRSPRTARRYYLPSRSTARDRLQFGLSRSVGLGSSKQQLQSG